MRVNYFLTLTTYLKCSYFANVVSGGVSVVPPASVAGSVMPPESVAGVVASVIGPQPREFPCPDAAEIAPCICWTGEQSRLNLDSSNITSNEALNTVFLNPFPVKNFLGF